MPRALAVLALMLTLVGARPAAADFWGPGCQAAFLDLAADLAPAARYDTLDRWWTASPVPAMPDCEPYPFTLPPLPRCTAGLGTPDPCADPASSGGFCYPYDPSHDGPDPRDSEAGWRCVDPPTEAP